MTWLRLDEKHALQVSRTLFDVENEGGLPIRSALTETARHNLRKALNDMSGLFRDKSGSYKNAYQEFELLTLGEADESSHPAPPIVISLRDEFAEWYRLLGRHAKFETTGGPNSIMAQRYPKGSAGITPHMDESRLVNLIAIFVLEGEAPFGICETRDKERKVEFAVGPGDLMPLRAPRIPEAEQEKSRRPMHYVGPVEKPRLSLTFREEAEG